MTRSSALTSLRGRPVERDGVAVGTLIDVVVAEGGAIVEVILGTDAGEQRLPFDGSMRIQTGSRSAA